MESIETGTIVPNDCIARNRHKDMRNWKRWNYCPFCGKYVGFSFLSTIAHGK